MNKKSGRRKFIKNFGISGITAGLIPSSLLETGEESPVAHSEKADTPVTEKGSHTFNGSYTGEYLNRIAFPIGGLGAGMFCLEGTGAFSHMSVRNRPEIFNEPGMFAAICVKGLKNGAKVLEGPVPDWKKFGQQGAGNGLAGATIGLPR